MMEQQAHLVNDRQVISVSSATGRYCRSAVGQVCQQVTDQEVHLLRDIIRDRQLKGRKSCVVAALCQNDTIGILRTAKSRSIRIIAEERQFVLVGVRPVFQRRIAEAIFFGVVSRLLIKHKVGLDRSTPRSGGISNTLMIVGKHTDALAVGDAPLCQ